MANDYVPPRWLVAAVVAAMLVCVLCAVLPLFAAAWHLLKGLRQVSR